MNKTALIAFLIASTALLGGCAGGRGGAGHWFLLIFILAPLVVIGVMLLKKSDALADSLYTIEGQIKRLSARLDGIEEKLKKTDDRNDKPSSGK